MPRSRRRAARRVTIKDVAREAGVSPTTVSNVLNDRTDAMSPETLQRIREAIRKLNYRPSSIARGLVTRSTATVGLILAEIETPLFLQPLNLMETLVRNVGYNLLLCTAHNVSDEQQAVDLLLEKRVDGIIVLSTSEYLDDDHLIELSSFGVPVVLVNRATVHEDFSQVNWDNVGGVTSAVEYLVGLGHRRIAHLSGPVKRRSSRERLDGYRLGLERAGIGYNEGYIRPGDYTAQQEDWKQSTIELLGVSPRPTAIIASDDIVAAVAMKTVQNAGLRVPQDISIVGIDDQPFSVYLNPSLTTAKLPVVEAGELGIKMLLYQLGSRDSDVEHVMLPCPLIVRESSGEAAS